jgi:hypothetical protein
LNLRSNSSTEGNAVANSDSVRPTLEEKRPGGGGEEGGEREAVACVTKDARSEGGGEDATEDVGEGGPKDEVETKVWGEEMVDNGIDGELARGGG